MAKYCVNKNAQTTGEHEVHTSTCDRKPLAENSIYLGEHLTCEGAVVEAKKHYSNVDGCFYCSKACHTR